MKVIVGLGNPGKEYERSRHNAGFMVVDTIKDLRFKNYETGSGLKKSVKLDSEIWKSKELLLCKPLLYMNRSGEVVQKILSYYDVDPADLVVIHDDLDIDFGNVKAQFGKGPKVHNGVNSIEQALGTKDFWRVRIGVDSRSEDEKQMPGHKYVLKPMNSEELSSMEMVIEEVVGRIVDELV